MAPWKLLGGLWRPWAALGRPRRIFERFWELWGVPFGSPKSIKKALKNKLNPNLIVDAYFGPSGGSLGHFWGPFWRYFKVLFEVPSREAGFLKNLEQQLEKQLFLRLRGIQRRSKIGPETASSRSWAARASWKALGVGFGGLWGPCWVPKSVQKGVGKLVEICMCFSRVLGRARPLNTRPPEW